MKCFASSIDGPGPKAAGTHGRGRERCDGHAAALCRPRPMNTVIAAFVDVRTRAKMAQRKKLAWYLLGLQPLLAIECLVTNEGHRGRRLATATLLVPPSSRGFTPPLTAFASAARA